MPIIQDFFVKSTFVSLIIDEGAGTRDSASGFFYKHRRHYYLITNLHVVEIPEYEDSDTLEDLEDPEITHPDELFIYVRYNPTDLTETTREKVDLFDEDENPRWITHSNPAVDLVAIPLDIDLSITQNRSYSKSDFPPEDNVILGGDSAMAIGYPKGLYDANTYFPVIRDGLIATPPNADYKTLPVFLMDAKMHNGTSGSPVLTQPSAMQRKEDGFAMVSGTPTYLLGIHSGPEYAPEPRGEEEEYDPTLDLNMVWRAELIEEMLDSRSR